MSTTLRDRFREVEPCTDFDALQIIGDYVVDEVLELRQNVCNKGSEIFATVGLEGFQPCTFIDEKFLEELQSQQPLDVMQTLLASRGFPPHVIDFFKEGPARLQIEKYQDIIEWVSPLVGVQTHPDTAQYIRDTAVNAERRLLDTAGRLEVQNFYIRQGIAEIEPLIQEKLTTFITSKITAPDQDQLQEILRVLSNIQRFVNNLNKRFQKFQETLEAVARTINILNSIVQSLDKIIKANDIAIPILSAIRFTAGAATILANLSRTLSTFVERYKPVIEELNNRVCNLLRLSAFVAINLNVISTILTTIEALLRALLANSATGALAENQLQLLSNLPFPVIPSSTPRINYRGYDIEIRVEQPTDENIAIISAEFNIPRYYAVAIDPVGVVVLSGTPSFSSSTQVLIDELKFRIDNQLG